MQFPFEPTVPINGPCRQGPDWQQTVDTYVSLKLRLHEVQTRLGTQHERADDIQSAQELAHRIANIRTALTLWSGLARLRSQQPQTSG